MYNENRFRRKMLHPKNDAIDAMLKWNSILLMCVCVCCSSTSVPFSSSNIPVFKMQRAYLSCLFYHIAIAFSYSICFCIALHCISFHSAQTFSRHCLLGRYESKRRTEFMSELGGCVRMKIKYNSHKLIMKIV